MQAMHCIDCCSLSTHARNQVSTAWDFPNCTAGVLCSSFFMMNLYNSKQCRNAWSLSMCRESMSGALKAVVRPSPHHPTAPTDFSHSKVSSSSVTYIEHCPLWRDHGCSELDLKKIRHATRQLVAADWVTGRLSGRLADCVNRLVDRVVHIDS